MRSIVTQWRILKRKEGPKTKNVWRKAADTQTAAPSMREMQVYTYGRNKHGLSLVETRKKKKTNLHLVLKRSVELDRKKQTSISLRQDGYLHRQMVSPRTERERERRSLGKAQTRYETGSSSSSSADSCQELKRKVLVFLGHLSLPLSFSWRT